MFEYRKGFFAGVLAVHKFLEMVSTNGIFRTPKEKFEVVRAALKDILENNKIDYFMDYEEKIQFKYKYEKSKVTYMEVKE